MATRLPPKAMAKKLVRLLRPQYPDAHYLKKVFQHTRMLLDVPPSLHRNGCLNSSPRGNWSPSTRPFGRHVS
jgi:hypothetical protein